MHICIVIETEVYSVQLLLKSKQEHEKSVGENRELPEVHLVDLQSGPLSKGI